MKQLITAFCKIILFLPFVFQVASCKKELSQRAFKLQSKTFYRVAPITPASIEVNGVPYVSFAYFPGGGTGSATHMGAVTHYFNQLAYGTSPSGPPAGSLAAPVSDVPYYPVLGGPLPLIQTGDFAALATLITSLGVPTEVDGKIVNEVIYNGKGDALFISAITGSGSTFLISEIIVGFKGKAIIVGGRGRFANAVGELDYDGYFNVTDAADAEYNAEGWINY